jgi:hypothetical protein
VAYELPTTAHECGFGRPVGTVFQSIPVDSLGTGTPASMVSSSVVYRSRDGRISKSRPMVQWSASIRTSITCASSNASSTKEWVKVIAALHVWMQHTGDFRHGQSAPIGQLENVLFLFTQAGHRILHDCVFIVFIAVCACGTLAGPELVLKGLLPLPAPVRIAHQVPGDRQQPRQLHRCALSTVLLLPTRKTSAAISCASSGSLSAIGKPVYTRVVVLVQGDNRQFALRKHDFPQTSSALTCRIPEELREMHCLLRIGGGPSPTTAAIGPL